MPTTRTIASVENTSFGLGIVRLRTAAVATLEGPGDG